MFTYVRAFCAILIVGLLTGCLYPSNELAKNEVPNEDQLELVQTAVENYQEKTQGLVPIKTMENDTPIFRKYLIDFNLLKEQSLITEIPGNAYENGGIYQYTIITPDDNPRVKLIDLRITEAIRTVNVKLNIYRNKNTYPPFGEQIEDGIFMVNYEKLGLENEPYIVSPYSQNHLPIVMDSNGELFVDYRIDLNDALKEYTHSYIEGDDIRFLLAENTPFVPAYSLPYTIHNNEPVFK